MQEPRVRPLGRMAQYGYEPDIRYVAPDALGSLWMVEVQVGCFADGRFICDPAKLRTVSFDGGDRVKRRVLTARPTEAPIFTLECKEIQLFLGVHEDLRMLL